MHLIIFLLIYIVLIIFCVCFKSGCVLCVSILFIDVLVITYVCKIRWQQGRRQKPAFTSLRRGTWRSRNNRVEFQLNASGKRGSPYDGRSCISTTILTTPRSRLVSINQQANRQTNKQMVANCSHLRYSTSSNTALPMASNHTLCCSILRSSFLFCPKDTILAQRDSRCMTSFVPGKDSERFNRFNHEIVRFRGSRLPIEVSPQLLWCTRPSLWRSRRQLTMLTCIAS